MAMNNCCCGIELELDRPRNISIEPGTPYIGGSSDYEKLANKPKINNVELIGNKLLNDLFPDGIIIDGGTAEGAV